MLITFTRYHIHPNVLHYLHLNLCCSSPIVPKSFTRRITEPRRTEKAHATLAPNRFQGHIFRVSVGS